MCNLKMFLLNRKNLQSITVNGKNLMISVQVICRVNAKKDYVLIANGISSTHNIRP